MARWHVRMPLVFWMENFAARMPTAQQGTSDMVSDQQNPLVICVSPGLNGKWDVSEKGAEQPLTSFDDKEDAYAYASDLTRSREGATALVEDEEGFYLLPPQYGHRSVRRSRSRERA